MNWTTLFDFSYSVMSSFNDWLINTANGDMAKANLILYLLMAIPSLLLIMSGFFLFKSPKNKFHN